MDARQSEIGVMKGIVALVGLMSLVAFWYSMRGTLFRELGYDGSPLSPQDASRLGRERDQYLLIFLSTVAGYGILKGIGFCASRSPQKFANLPVRDELPNNIEFPGSFAEKMTEAKSIDDLTDRSGRQLVNPESKEDTPIVLIRVSGQTFAAYDSAVVNEIEMKNGQFKAPGEVGGVLCSWKNEDVIVVSQPAFRGYIRRLYPHLVNSVEQDYTRSHIP